MERAKFIRTLAWMGALLSVSLQVHAQVAGRVLLASGEVTAMRDGKAIPLAAGAPIQDRDTLTTGAASNLQVRLTDESIISLRQNSQLRLDEYKFTGKADGQERALFRLLKGGFRTITGLIGRANHNNYAVTTVAATIGIRGTMYALAQCQGDCQNEDGSLAADGVYGSVLGSSHGTDSITATNKAGESVLGMNQHFHVADVNSAPIRLLEPPYFLQDRLSGAKPKPKPFPAAAPVADGGAGAESRPSTFPDLMTAITLRPDINVTRFTSLNASIVNDASPMGGGSGLPGGTGNLQTGGFSAALTINQAQTQFVDVGGAGIIRGQLVWLNSSDMDLHMTAPNAAHIYFGNTTVTLPGGATATLDADNLGGVINVAPNKRVENIVVTGATPPVGAYTFFVNAFSTSTPTSSVLTVTGDNNVTNRVHNVPALSSGQNSQNYQVIFNGLTTPPTYNP